METIQNREKFIQIVSERGYQGLLNHLRGLFPNLDLYSMSQDWMHSPGFILKAKGGYGDLIVTWEKESGDVLKLGKQTIVIQMDEKSPFSLPDGHYYCDGCGNDWFADYDEDELKTVKCPKCGGTDWGEAIE